MKKIMIGLVIVLMSASYVKQSGASDKNELISSLAGVDITLKTRTIPLPDVTEHVDISKISEFKELNKSKYSNDYISTHSIIVEFKYDSGAEKLPYFAVITKENNKLHKDKLLNVTIIKK